MSRMIRYVLYKSYSVNANMNIKCKLNENFNFQGRILRGLQFSTGVRNYVLIYCNRSFLQNHKIIPNLVVDCLRNIYMSCNKRTRQCGWSLSTGVERFWRVGQQFLFLLNGS